MSDLDIEPDEPTEMLQQIVEPASYMPQDFPLLTLLRFMPDVRLKYRVEALAKEALAIEVRGAEGLRRADEALAALRLAIDDASAPFADPTDLANQLHKRLTGLRADFVKGGQQTVTFVGQRIYAEKKRMEQEAVEAQRKAQAEADARARADAEQAAKDAAKRKAPKDVIAAMKDAAKNIVAPPVPSPLFVPTLASSTTVENWKARFVGTPEGAESNPDTSELTPSQLIQCKLLLDAIVAGHVPIVFVSIDWGEINRRANRERSTFSVPGLEVFDAGGTRSKGRR